MTQGKQDLTSGEVSTNLRRQAVPFGIALVAIFSFEAVDLFFISRLGDTPLAAVSFCFPVIWLVYGIGIGLEAGVASCVSRAVGRKDEEGAKRMTTDTALLGGGLFILLALTGIFFIEPTFTMLGATPAVMPVILDYMSVWYWVAPVDAVLWISLASIRARGNTVLESKFIIAAAILNLILDPLLIFGLLGFPELGVKGAALATVISTTTILILALGHLIWKLQVFATPIARMTTIFASWKHVLSIGIPAMITNAIIPLSGLIVVAMIAKYGVDSVAGFGIATRIEPMVLIPFYALSAVVSPFFGQNSGAFKFDRLFEARRILTIFCFGLGMLLALTLGLLAKPIAALYTDSAEISQVAVHYLWIVSLSYGAYGLVMSMNAAFNGMGHPLPGVAISTMRVIVLFLPLAFLGKAIFGINGLFIAASISNITLGLIGWFWLGKQIEKTARKHQLA
ncbi:MAG TPA: MATE family efflux transporter [Xanthomonadales bacterium]|nr:MATE family efflux transporter [Xanthomonadales bacterium]